MRAPKLKPPELDPHSQAVEIIDREWRAEGFSQEELDRSRQVARLFARLVASGQSADDILARWEGRSPEEILEEAKSSRSRVTVLLARLKAGASPRLALLLGRVVENIQEFLADVR